MKYKNTLNRLNMSLKHQFDRYMPVRFYIHCDRKHTNGFPKTATKINKNNTSKVYLIVITENSYIIYSNI